MNRIQLVNDLTDYLKHQGHIIDGETDLFESGAIDSMSIIELICFLEESLKINFDTEQLIGSNFRTIDTIVDLIILKFE